jgi:hypothetical protein
MPEWSVVDPAKRYRLTDMKTGKVAEYTGRTLIAGIPVTISLTGHFTLEEAGLAKIGD